LTSIPARFKAAPDHLTGDYPIVTTDPAPAPGQPAPEFDLPASGGGTTSLAGIRGRNVVLYFYPKDDTSGCTREALDFTAAAADFAAAGTVVLGISKDSVKKHDRFIQKHGLDVILLADEDGAVCARYGTWIEKSMYGRRYMGIDRATFLIDAAGTVRHVWRKVKVSGHVDEVLAAARAL
jgi:peroxiredoxin Q/BCP